MKLSVSYYWTNKQNTAPLKPNKDGVPSNLYANSAFTNVDWTQEQIGVHVRSGKAICGAELVGNWRTTDNFVSSQLVGLDFDHSPGIDVLVKHEFLRAHAFLIYPTASHTAAMPRHRALLALDAPITDASHYECLMRRLVAYFADFGVDPACVDPVRKWNGSDVEGGRNGKEKTLPLSVLEELPKTADELKPPLVRQITPFKPTDDRQLKRAQDYSAAAKRNLLNEALSTPSGAGIRHGAYNAAVMQLFAMQKGGWLGFENAVTEAEWLGEAMGREREEIKGSIKGAEKKAKPFDFELPPEEEFPRKSVVAKNAVTESANGNGNHAPTAEIVWKSNGDGIQLFRERQQKAPELLGKKPPMIFPLRVLHRFGGLFHVMKTGYVMATIGGSGTTKTGWIETVTGTMMEQYPIEVLWWGVEMNWEVSADRAVQRLGGTTVTQNWLHELWLSEEHNQVPHAQRQGVRLHPKQISDNIQKAGDIEYGWRGHSHQIEAPLKSVEVILEAFADKASDLRKQGLRPDVCVFDYLQLLEMTGGGDASTKMARLMTTVKKHANYIDYFGFAVSQITKNASMNAKQTKEAIEVEAAQNFRSDETNAAITLTPVYDADGNITKQGIMKVAKNSFGMSGQVKVWIDPARFTWLDEEVIE